VEEEEEEEHDKNGMNDKLVNPTADDGARCDGGCGRRRAAAVAAIAAVAVQSGHVASANLVQVYRGMDIGLNKPTDVKLRCTPHHLINFVDPPVVLVIVVDVIISYDTIVLYSRSKIFQV
jgi:hypothetical protein